MRSPPNTRSNRAELPRHDARIPAGLRCKCRQRHEGERTNGYEKGHPDDERQHAPRSPVHAIPQQHRNQGQYCKKVPALGLQSGYPTQQQGTCHDQYCATTHNHRKRTPVIRPADSERVQRQQDKKARCSVQDPIHPSRCKNIHVSVYAKCTRKAFGRPMVGGKKHTFDRHASPGESDYAMPLVLRDC